MIVPNRDNCFSSPAPTTHMCGPHKGIMKTCFVFVVVVVVIEGLRATSS